MAAVDVAGYLRRLGLGEPAQPARPPSVPSLRALHVAHVERVPYETLAIHLGRRTTVDPAESAARIVRGRGGYCYHLNGGFSALLSALGYRVTWHRGGVQRRGGAPGITANHLALTVSGLPDDDSPAGDWLVDVGLGDALYEPVPLRAGEYRQGGFGFRLRRSEVAPGGWRLDHDERGSFAGMDFEPGPATATDFAAMHEWLSTSPESGFVRVFTALRRHATGLDVVRGCSFLRIAGNERTEAELATAADWYGLLADVYGLTLDDIGAAERAALWTRVRTAHDEWLAASAAG